MSILSAKAFRQQTMNPAEGLFLFHPRAVERLIEGQLGARLDGVAIPNLPYYLMPRADFLNGLETENPEALSVIEGLRLPPLVILLPSPPEQRLEPDGFSRLRNEYWGRAFEAEVARAWQTGREDHQDQARFGAAGLIDLIGAAAFAEVREVLARDGRTLPIWEDDLICRAFVAAVVRLRYFATGARGFFFPAIQVWAELDAWLSASGLDLPAPRQRDRLPLLLVKSRPGGGGQLPPLPLLPLSLPYGCCDPDQPLDHRAADQPPDPPASAPPSLPSGGLAEACLAAIDRGSQVRRRRGWAMRIGAGLRTAGIHLLGWFLLPTAPYPPAAEPPAPPGGLTGLRQRIGIALVQRGVARAQQAEFHGRFAVAIAALAEVRRVLSGLLLVAGESPARAGLAPVEQGLASRESACEAALADLLAARWRLPLAVAEELRRLVGRLAAEERTGYGSLSARLLLGHLEQVLNECRGDYYRLRPGHLLRRLPLREVLPFQSLLKSLRALQAARLRLEELTWPLADLERFGNLLDALTGRVADRLDAQLTPRLERAMREADFLPRDHRERVAAHKMKHELLDLIRRRRHLKFTDVRDVVARNILRLPDPRLHEFLHGDRLRRFDDTAGRALPGVYRPGEFYIKGLQQLSAPLFGTDGGRTLLRHGLLPFGGAYVLLKTTDMVIAMLPGPEAAIRLTDPLGILVLGGLVNLFVYSELGRHLGIAIASTAWRMTRFLLWDGPRGFVRWGPVAALLATGLMRGVGRHIIAPLLIGVLPLIPIIAVAVFVEEVPLRPGLWLLGLAFALGTLARNTPTGRRFLDNLVTDAARLLQRINQTLVIGLITQLMFFFKEVTRRFSQVLHRVEETLTPRLGERWYRLLPKALFAPVWRLLEAVLQFYVTVLVEPQVNPVKHFPIVSIGHKIMLPFLPAITGWFLDISHAVLPAFVALPLVTLTILLLPGLFGFLVWELKENYKLYEANHRRPLFALAGPPGPDPAPAPIEPAVVGSHGEDMRGLMARGFHSGTLPKAFDRLRRVIREQQRDEQPYPKRLRRCERQLREVRHALAVFIEREFTYALAERCRDARCTLGAVSAGEPRLATNLVEFEARLQPRVGTDPAGPAALLMDLRIAWLAGALHVETRLHGERNRLGPVCWAMIGEDLRLFAARVGARHTVIDPVFGFPERVNS